jgi:hypothetical protein
MVNDKVKDLASQLSKRFMDAAFLANSLAAGDTWVKYNETAKSKGTAFAIGFELSIINRLCDEIDEEMGKNV